ncbi:MAG TPA: ATP-binding protein [Thiobacillaceae bacterium]|nr:ATP-binding protein [Thiobacillaceae bacterium]
MRAFDLSLRHKLPLWGGMLIVLTALLVTGSNLLQTRENIKRNMLARSEILGRAMISNLYDDLVNDDVWGAYERITAPARAEKRQPSFQIQSFIVLDENHAVFVSSEPRRHPLLTDLAGLGPDFARLKASLAQSRGHTRVVEGEHILLGIPVVAEGVTLGTLVVVHKADYYQPSYLRILKRTAWTTLIILLILLPISWFWGRRMAHPLVLLAGRMSDVGKGPPEPLPERTYPHEDELGQLFRVYDRMQRELRDKHAMERQMLKADRLAALGRLTAGIAHEINNPLGGLLTAVDTLKRHAGPDPVTRKVLPLLERGLIQIQDIVGALLVEARAKSRPLTAQDVEDVHTLLAQEARKRNVEWTWENTLSGEVPLPATLVRQLLINLLLNAVRAAGERGHVEARIAMRDGCLALHTRNDGRTIPPELMEHLFEPFTGGNEEGTGLGLWISYQIVQQLGGDIRADSREGWTAFSVSLPLGEA